MAQMFSSGITPDYLQTLADAYAQYFPQQAPVNTQALQQWYSPQGGSSAFAAPMGAAAPSSVVGSLFGDQYPQTQGGGSRGSVSDSNPGWSGLSDSQKASFYADNPTMSSLTQGLQGMFAKNKWGLLQNALFPDFVKDQQLIAMGINPNPLGTLADMGIVNQVQDPMQRAQADAISRAFGGMSVGGYAPGSQAGAAAAAGTVGGYGPGTPGFNGGRSGGDGGGAATGGSGGDASGGGDRGTRGGF